MAATDQKTLANLIKPALGNDPSAVSALLLSEWRSLAGVLYAPRSLLAERAGAAVADVIEAVRYAICAVLRAQASRQPDLGSAQALVDYLHARMAHLRHEETLAVYLDAANRFIDDHLIASGSSNRCPVSVSAVLRRAIELGAVGIILAHNHPSGETTPSRSDIEVTRTISALATSLDMTLVDHFILTRRDWFSFRIKGLL